jgi:hypothetical protein
VSTPSAESVVSARTVRVISGAIPSATACPASRAARPVPAMSPAAVGSAEKRQEPSEGACKGLLRGWWGRRA